MALIQCKECGKKISSQAKACPNCGLEPPHWGSLVVLAVLLFVCPIIYGIFSAQSSTKPAAGLVMPTLPGLTREYVTFTEFQAIREGMSYRQVESIIGTQGELVSRAASRGVPGYIEPTQIVMYQWKNDNGSNMNAMFKNDQLISKAQFGLR